MLPTGFSINIAFMKRLFFAIISFLPILTAAQKQVNQNEMQHIYEQVKTPYKYGLVVAPEDNNHKIDCPTVFRVGDKWMMTYVVYNGKGGTDGRGYETWIAQSDNLLEWKTLGRILSYKDEGWDCNQRGGFPALPDMEWGGSYELHKYKGKNWMTYIGGKGTGYEAVREPLNIGLAWSDRPLDKAFEWSTFDKPIISIYDKDAQWWEQMTEYKSTIYWDKSKRLGAPFVMFYNAGGRNPENGIKGERVGIALSKDMKRWKRYAGNPVFAHEANGTITGDAHIQKMGDIYVMFYFSAFSPDRRYKAFNTFAASYDLVNWTDWNGADLIFPSKEYDELFAHKSYVIKYNGVVYHFYCAVNSAEQRGIAVATSKPMGKSALSFPQRDNKNRREEINLNSGWKSWITESNNGDKTLTKKAIMVDLPHNWDDYYGYRQLTHGNLHGTAIYEKEFSVEPNSLDNRECFIRFEGVGSYATITLNGKEFGRRLIGRTTYTLNVSDVIHTGKNRLTVKVEHPEMISDSPWVCGGCSSEWGFSEGSQPFGIFRPVVLEFTDKIRIEPFGVHIWNDDNSKTIYLETEVKNYSNKEQNIELVNKFSNADGKQVFRLTENLVLKPGETRLIKQQSAIENAILWSCEKPYLYKLATMIKRDAKTTDEMVTPFGIRTVSWPVKRNDNDGRFYLNGKPLFINGVCEYEHQFGQSHAFTNEQIKARVKEIEGAGFNAFRDAHQPHNLEYQKYWDRDGILFWPQFSAHIWYDTPEFRENFKSLLRQWVKERRNSPSVVMWGLQNESTLPKDFANECCDIIREMDPTAVNMRVITTCNGGEGSDWNVIQNWSGTYGGYINQYGKELSKKEQLLNGEYGSWRSLGLHTEPGKFEQNGIWSEERMCKLMETKIRLAEEAKDSVCGQFQWIFSSHDNPGRRQPDEAYRVIDKVGPFNYKGLLTPWEEPLDVYYMYKANYVSAEKEPMVYLSSHTWHDRFKGECKATIEAYSNCDSVLLYNDASDGQLIGSQENGVIGKHFEWRDAHIKYNVLRAVGYYKGKPVTEDILVLDNLEKSPKFDNLYKAYSILPVAADNIVCDIKGAVGYNYLYRINCGGDEYTDSHGQLWNKDNSTWSSSWADEFVNSGNGLITPYQASQRVTNDPVHGTKDWKLFQSFRFGRHKLNYTFPVENGKYRVELYFMEPWFGTGASEKSDCEGMRLFDVAINGKQVIDDLDLWAERGHDGAYKRVVYVDVDCGEIKISFPEVKAAQAVISAIAIASTNNMASPKVSIKDDKFSWTAQESNVMVATPDTLLPINKSARASVSYQAENALIEGKYVVREVKKERGVFFDKGNQNSIKWNISTGLAQIYAFRFKYMNLTGKAVKVNMKLVDSKGVVLKSDELTFAETPEKWRMISTTSGSFINAGHYSVILSAPDMKGLAFDALDVQ